MRLLAMVLVWALLAGPASASRLALIVTNEAYGAGVGALVHPHADGARVAASLRALGFAPGDIVHRRDLTREQTRAAFANHAERVALAGPGAIGFVYYSGHGASARAGGDTYLIPVDAPALSVQGLPGYGYKLETLIESLSLAPARAHIVLLDACRDVPIRGLKGRGHKGAGALPRVSNMVVGFSAAPGRAALDAPHYSTALADVLATPGLDIALVMRDVRDRVQAITGGAQVPEHEDEITGRLCLNGPCMGTAPVDPCAGQALEGHRCTVMNGRAVFVPLEGAQIAMRPPAPAPPARTAAEIAQERYRCFKGGVQGIDFAGKCWPLDTTTIWRGDISHEFWRTITGTAPLAGLRGLTSLSLSGTAVTGIAALSGLTGLMELNLSGTSVTNIGALSGLTSLTMLNLSGTSVTEIGALSGLTSLTVLSLSETSITDISALSSLAGLTRLDLSGTSIKDFGALLGLTALHWLVLPDGTQVGSYADTLASRAIVYKAIYTAVREAITAVREAIAADLWEAIRPSRP